ncbi:MAG: hypothetical protein JXR96_02560 [Deltaproteobacteria bacterium]|nr:hypothetical protein [Deltaproteobacteria bacterium]
MTRAQRILAGSLLVGLLIAFHVFIGTSLTGTTFYLQAQDAIGKGEYAKARELMELAVNWHPGSADKHFGLGEAFFFSGDLGGAAQAFDQGFAIDLWNRDRFVVQRPDGTAFDIACVRGAAPECEGDWESSVRLWNGQALPEQEAAGKTAMRWNSVICFRRRIRGPG